MHISTEQLQSFGENELRTFLARRIPEGHHLDYKRQLSGKNKTKQYHEFLKDVTAFANANGGDILIGVREPKDGLSIDDQIVGIEDGESVAHNLERLAASGTVDPRIPGLKIAPVRLSNGLYAIVAHVPPSLGKPHMVTYDKHQSIHIRHSESVQPMTSFDIRESVLSSASAEVRAKNYLSVQEKDVAEYMAMGVATLVFQAMPVVRPESPIDVMAEELVACLQSDERRRKYEERADLSSMARPCPTMDGVEGKDSREDPAWVSQLHRNGYVGVAFKLLENKEWRKEPDKNPRYILFLAYRQVFQSFCDLCGEFILASGFDSPYIMRCKVLNAVGVTLVMGTRYVGSWNKPEIEWPDLVRETGESFAPISDVWWELLYNAFGQELPPEQQTE